MPGHRHNWVRSNQGETRRCMECGEIQYRGPLPGEAPKPSRGVPQDRLPPQTPNKDYLPPMKVTKPGGVVFDPEMFKIASVRMSAGMMGVQEAADALNRSMQAIVENGPLAQSVQAQVTHDGRRVIFASGPVAPPPPFDDLASGSGGFGNHEIEASPSEALDIIVRYLHYVAKERPNELRQIASKWMTRMTDAVTGVLKEVERGESE